MAPLQEQQVGAPHHTSEAPCPKGGDQPSAHDDGERTAQFRRYARAYYRRATSVAASRQNSLAASSTAGASDSGEEEEEEPSSSSEDASASVPLSGGSALSDAEESKVVMEALELLCHSNQHGGCQHSAAAAARNNGGDAPDDEAYRSFLSRNSAHGAALARCGLAEHPGNNTGTIVQEYVTIRSEERRRAHEMHMSERRRRLLTILAEMDGHRAAAERGGGVHGDGGGAPNGEIGNADARRRIISRAEVKRIRSTVKEFVRRYHRDHVASHPFLAGLRRVLESQLEESSANRSSVAVRWTFDGIALTEAIRTKACGAGGDDAYVRDALGVIASFMVWIPIEEKVEEGAAAAKSERPLHNPLTFEVDPALSDRTLRRVLDAMPRTKDLHGRPTGTVERPSSSSSVGVGGSVAGATARTNVDGAWDEKGDVCHDFMDAFGGLRLAFCRK